MATQINVPNIQSIEGTVMLKDSFVVAARAAKRGQEARPARTVGVLSIVTNQGEYVEVTDFTKAWTRISIDGRYRMVVDKQDRERDGRTVTYYNLKRAMQLHVEASADEESSVLAEA